jgi:hypothetical protein
MKTRVRGKRRVAVALLVAVLLGAGCAPTPTASPSTPSPTPGRTDRCGGMDVAPTRVPLPIRQLVSRAGILVAGRIVAIGSPIYNTPDNRQPDWLAAGAFSDRDPAPVIVRPVEIEVEVSVTGPIKPGTVDAFVAGGAIGCYSFTDGGAPNLTTGQRYLLQMVAGYDHFSGRSPGASWVINAYTINANDVVSAEDGPIALDKVLELAAGVSPSPST